MTLKEKNIGGGLIPSKKDRKDFSLTKAFGAIDVSEIPDYDFVVAEPLGIFNQGNSDMCVAFAATAVNQDQERVLLSPEYLFAKAKQLNGEWKSWGLDLRTICKAMVKFGCIEKKDSPFELKI